MAQSPTNSTPHRELNGITVWHNEFEPAPPFRHAHNLTVLSFLVRGKTIETDPNGKSQIANPYSVSVQPSGYLHSHQNEAPITVVCAHVCPSFLGSISLREESIPAGVVSSNSIARICYRISAEMQRRDASSNLVLAGLYLELLGEMHRASRHEESKRPAWIESLRDLLERSFREQLNLASISADFDVHPCHLSRVFRQEMGCSPTEYVRELRLSLAVEMLTQSAMTTGEIAAESGFADRSHLHRHIRRRYGMSPTELRQMIRASTPTSNLSALSAWPPRLNLLQGGDRT